MTVEREGVRRQRKWQFSIRELVAVTVIIALFLGFWHERRLHNQALEQLDRVSMHLVVWHPTASSRWIAGVSSVSVNGTFYSVRRSSLLDGDVRIILELFKPNSSEPVRKIEAKVTAGEGFYQFRGKFADPQLSKGRYAVTATCLLDDEPLVAGSTVFEVVADSVADLSAEDAP